MAMRVVLSVAQWPQRGWPRGKAAAGACSEGARGVGRGWREVSEVEEKALLPPEPQEVILGLKVEKLPRGKGMLFAQQT